MSDQQLTDANIKLACDIAELRSGAADDVIAGLRGGAKLEADSIDVMMLLGAVLRLNDYCKAFNAFGHRIVGELYVQTATTTEATAPSGTLSTPQNQFVNSTLAKYAYEMQAILNAIRLDPKLPPAPADAPSELSRLRKEVACNAAVIAGLRESREQLIEMIDRIPTTCDGVSIFPGMTVFVDYRVNKTTKWVGMNSVNAVSTHGLYRCDGSDTFHGLPCYSTREAALAAQSGKSGAKGGGR